MRPKHILPPAAALALLAWLWAPLPGEAYALLGGSLGLDQRDFRVFPNFTDPEATDHTTPDPNFPGATGPVLAIWKACVEWGSELHGSGGGDPHQPGDLGSGGANFDAVFQGLAAGPGTTNDNVFSEISGGSLGVLAFTELPISDGWRIRFYAEPWVWEDSPSGPSSASGHKDIQGVATHEYGHALGLDHSFLGTTMQANSAGTLVSLRSIEADDIAGIQFLYGVRAPSKPHIESYTLGAGTVELRGEHFDATANEVWFTRAGTAGDGTPVKVGPLAATHGGRRITVPIPPEAGPGDVFVKVPGSSGDALSNAFPFDPGLDFCPGAQLYGTPKPNSGFGVPALFTTGLPSATWNDFRIGTAGGLPNQLGVLFHGPARAERPFLGGTLYVAAPRVRDRVFQFDFTGYVELDVPVTPAMVGTQRCYQLWYVDPGDPFGAGLSDAVAVTFCP